MLNRNNNNNNHNNNQNQDQGFNGLRTFDGTSSMKDFQILSKLGEGSFSCVYKVRRISDNLEYAMKKVKMNMLKDKEQQNALNEVRILASLQEEYIVSYYDAFIDDSTLCVVMEYAGGGDMQHKIDELKKNKNYCPEAEIWKCIIQISKGLKALHDKKILHRDLKCANVFLTKNGDYKLGDLNVSKVAQKGLVYTQTGTPYYASPEVWRDEAYDIKSDIWSLGCVVYELAAQKPPFRANDMEGLYRKVQKGVFDRIPQKYSSDLSSVISACLKVNPNQRPLCDALLNNPIVIRNSGGNQGLGIKKVGKQAMQSQPELLQTIKLPKNLGQLKGKLPRAQYGKVLDDLLEENEEIMPQNPPVTQSLQDQRRGLKSAGQQRPVNNLYKKDVQQENQQNQVRSRPQSGQTRNQYQQQLQQQQLIRQQYEQQQKERQLMIQQRQQKIQQQQQENIPTKQIRPSKKTGLGSINNSNKNSNAQSEREKQVPVLTPSTAQNSQQENKGYSNLHVQQQQQAHHLPNKVNSNLERMNNLKIQKEQMQQEQENYNKQMLLEQKKKQLELVQKRQQEEQNLKSYQQKKYGNGNNGRPQSSIQQQQLEQRYKNIQPYSAKNANGIRGSQDSKNGRGLNYNQELGQSSQQQTGYSKNRPYSAVNAGQQYGVYGRQNSNNNQNQNQQFDYNDYQKKQMYQQEQVQNRAVQKQNPTKYERDLERDRYLLQMQKQAYDKKISQAKQIAQKDKFSYENNAYQNNSKQSQLQQSRQQQLQNRNPYKQQKDINGQKNYNAGNYQANQISNLNAYMKGNSKELNDKIQMLEKNLIQRNNNNANYGQQYQQQLQPRIQSAQPQNNYRRQQQQQLGQIQGRGYQNQNQENDYYSQNNNNINSKYRAQNGNKNYNQQQYYSNQQQQQNVQQSRQVEQNPVRGSYEYQPPKSANYARRNQASGQYQQGQQVGNSQNQPSWWG